MSVSSQLTPIPLTQASPTLRELAQQAGATVEAKVLGQLANGTTQVQIGRQMLALQFPEMPQVGATLTLAVQQAEGQVRVALVSVKAPPVAVTPPGSAPAAAPANAPATSIQLSPAALAAPPAPAPPSAGPVPAGPPASAATPSMPTSPVPGAPVSVAPMTPTQVSAPNSAPPPPVAASAVPGVMTPPAAVQSTVMAAGMPATPSPLVPGAAAVPVAVVPAAVMTAPAVARPAIPYAAAPAAPVAPVADTTMAPVGGAAGGATVGQQAAQANNPVPAQAQLGPSVAPPATASPAAALHQMVQQALPRQDSVVRLTTALANVVGRVALPPAVVKAAQQVLGQRLSLDTGKLDGAALQNAVRGSGLFQEALLAGGAARAAGGDMKSALLGLQRQLGAWLGNQAPVEQLSALPPPLKGQVPRAKMADLPAPDLPADPEIVGRALAERTEAALSRLRLHQAASLPEPQAQRQDAQWSMDLPVTVAGHQALLHMQIHRDPEEQATSPEERGWQVRFAINLSEAGEVGAQISMRGRATGVMIWTEQPETAELLATEIDALRGELEGLGLNVGSVLVRSGAPSATPSAASGPGHMVDAVG